MIDVQIIAPSPALRAGLAALLDDHRLRVSWALGAQSAQVFVLADDAQFPDRAREIAAVNFRPAIVALTTSASARADLVELNLCGWAVISPDVDRDELVMAVILAARGNVIVSAVEAAVWADASEPVATARPLTPLRDPLTPREQEVLELLSQGLPNKQIAHRLEISESTVKYHASSVYAKLGAASRADAVSRAARAGLITL